MHVQYIVSTPWPSDQFKHIHDASPPFIMSIIACLFYSLSKFRHSSISKDQEINNISV